VEKKRNEIFVGELSFLSLGVEKKNEIQVLENFSGEKGRGGEVSSRERGVSRVNKPIAGDRTRGYKIRRRDKNLERKTLGKEEGKMGTL